MFTWKCANCGAALKLEDDATEASCEYCGVTSRVRPPTPPSDPSAPAASKPRSAVFVALGAAGVLIGSALAVVVLRSSETSPVAVEPPPVDPSRETERAHDRVVARVRTLMVEQNCTPLVEPTDLRGAYDLVNTLQAGPTSRCVTLLAESAHQGNALKLWLNEPSGAAIKTPAPGASLHVRHCAETTGSHPARVVPEGDLPYTLAVVECPR